jgi:hypothetical protein
MIALPGIRFSLRRAGNPRGVECCREVMSESLRVPWRKAGFRELRLSRGEVHALVMLLESMPFPSALPSFFSLKTCFSFRAFD